MRKTIAVPLYGQLDHAGAPMAWDLMQTRAFGRLRDVSLCSTPSRFLPHGQAASRFTHSVAVAWLARRLADRFPQILGEHRSVLETAALCHDLGSAPLSHVSELFLYEQHGVTHEQRTLALLRDDPELSEILAEHDVDPVRVAAAICGEDPILGPVVAGSLDIDNIDNSVSLIASLGHAPDPLPYHPVTLLDEALVITETGPVLHTRGLRHVLGWMDTRRLLYDVLHCEVQQSSSVMLYRALEFARAQAPLPDGWETWTEGRLLCWLEDDAGPESAWLVDQLSCWRQFPRLAGLRRARPDQRICSLYDSWQLRRDFCDRVGDTLGIPARELCVYAGQDRAAKPIGLPWIGDRADQAAALTGTSAATQSLAVYAHKRHRGLPAGLVSSAVADALDDLPVASAAAHCFF